HSSALFPLPQKLITGSKHSLSKRFEKHQALREIWEVFKELRPLCDSQHSIISTGFYQKDFKFQFTAKFGDFVNGVVTGLGFYGEGARHNDHGTNAFGSFTLNGHVAVDCCAQKKWADITITNVWSMNSL